MNVTKYESGETNNNVQNKIVILLCKKEHMQYLEYEMVTIVNFNMRQKCSIDYLNKGTHAVFTIITIVNFNMNKKW